MDMKRLTSAVLGISVVIAVFLLENKYVVDVLLALVAFLALDEYFKAISKVSNPVKWIGYLSCISIAVIHLIPAEYLLAVSALSVPTILVILFTQVIVTQMKTSFKDITYTFLGIFYVVYFTLFVALIYGREAGNVLIWLTISASWAGDIFAYVFGKYFGKHKFSKVSPKKSIEGCIANIIGGITFMLIFTYCANTFWGQNFSYLYVAVIGIILNIIGQLGDFAASAIKRYVDIKDYSNLIPGHGGMLDRIDSLIFIAPFAYVLFMFI